MFICIQNKLINQGIALKDRKNNPGPENPVIRLPQNLRVSRPGWASSLSYSRRNNVA
jgi:hypothetical protein